MHWISLRAAWRIAAALALATGCIVDSDKPCDRGRVEFKGGATGCVCEPGSVPSSDGTSCMPCSGDHEEAMNGTCQCVSGYKRMGKSCVEEVDAGRSPEIADAAPKAPSGQDTACSSQDDCASFDADFCLPFPPTRNCAVRNCANKQTTCAGDRVCCDVSGASGIFPELMMADGICVTQAACAMGGKVVTP